MTNDITINGYDAYTRWGINLEEGALSALLAPPPIKAFIESRSRNANGKVVITKTPKWDSRDLTLPFHIIAPTKDKFYYQFNKFCEEVLKNGVITLSTKYQHARTLIVDNVAVTMPKVVYHLVYVSCTQFRQYQQGMGIFSLKVTEPDPSDRTEHVANNSQTQTT